MEEDQRLSSLSQILDHNQNTKEYYASFKGDIDDGWITILDDQHPKVVKYYKNIQKKVTTYEASTGDWMIPVWEDQT